MDAEGGSRRRLPRECRRVARLLPALPDGELRPTDAAFVERHLAACPTCQREAKAFTNLQDLVRQASVPDVALPSGEAAAAWITETARRTAGMSLGLDSEWDSGALAPWSPGRRHLLNGGLAFALTLCACLLAVRLFPGAERNAASWRVARLAGAPQCGSAPLHGTGRLRVGQWLKTDQASRARIEVAQIGQVQVEPNTQVRLVTTCSDQHRLALERGSLQAKISAPPRLFFVETPSAVAVDLGCAYTLKVDDAGRSFLRVTSGWVALVRDGLEVFVPQGARCETRGKLGLGTPYFEDAPRALRDALEQLDRGQGGSLAVSAVLDSARQLDSLTLWHLLPRVSPPERARLYVRLEALIPPPAGVTREGVLRLDQTMLNRWWKKIETTLWSLWWKEIDTLFESEEMEPGS